MIVNNIEIAGIVSRCRRFRYETVKAVSNALASTTDADFGRLKSYLAAIIQYVDHVVAQPQLDLPESAPMSIDIGDPEELTRPENEALVDLERLWSALENECANSQSARMATGIISHDEARIRAIVAKMESFLDNYVANVQPLDVPESSPAQTQTGPGLTGV